jgi:hypothetical protein
VVEDPLICLSPQNLCPPFPTEESKNISEIIRRSENVADIASKSVKEVKKIGQKDPLHLSTISNRKKSK